MTNIPIEKGQPLVKEDKTFSGIPAEEKTTTPIQPSTEIPPLGDNVTEEKKNDENDVDSTAVIYNDGGNAEFSKMAFLKNAEEEIKKEADEQKEIDGNLGNAIINQKKNNITPTID